MTRPHNRLLAVLWTCTILFVFLCSITAYVGPLNWLSGLLLWGCGFYTLLMQSPRLAFTIPAIDEWILYLLGGIGVGSACCYFATSPAFFAGWFVGLLSILMVLVTARSWISRLALLTTIAGLVVVPLLVVRHTSVRPSIAAGNHPHLKLMLRCGANSNGLSSMESPLSVAIRTGRADMVKTLLEHGADPNGHTSALFHSTPCLFEAAVLPAEQQGILRLLLNSGADPNLVNDLGQTALSCARSAKQPQNVKLLLEAGADTKTINGEGRQQKSFNSQRRLRG